MQLKTPQGQIVFEYKTRIPAHLESPSAAYFDSVNTPSGVAVLDHPMNLPTRWHNVLWMVNPCITSFGLLTVHPAEPLILRYRVVVHDGVTPTDLLQKLSVEWRGTKTDPFADRPGRSEQN